MDYEELYARYNELLKNKTLLEDELKQLPDGYIRTKKNGDNEYYYLQKRDGKTVTSKYLQANQVDTISIKLEKRPSLEGEIVAIDKELSKIEQAAKVLSGALFHRLKLLKQCMPMDAIDPEKRIKALQFSDTISALEGVPITTDTKTKQHRWAKGQISFADLYTTILAKYNMLEG